MLDFQQKASLHQDRAQVGAHACPPRNTKCSHRPDFGPIIAKDGFLSQF